MVTVFTSNHNRCKSARESRQGKLSYSYFDVPFKIYCNGRILILNFTICGFLGTFLAFSGVSFYGANKPAGRTLVIGL